MDDMELDLEANGKINLKDMTQVTSKSETVRPFRRVHCWPEAGDIVGTKDIDENLLRYENTVDMMDSSKIYVTYDDHQAFAALVLTVKQK